MADVTQSPAPPIAGSSRSVPRAGRHSANLGGVEPPAPGTLDYTAIQGSAEFQDIRRRLRSFAFPMSVGFFVWYVAYVLLADYAHGFMSRRVHGQINVGLVLGVLQFVSTVAITTAYVRFAAKNIDPRVEDLRRQSGVDGQ